MKEKVLLAFSGGLDTSFCAMYLAKEKGYEVHTAVANTGGFSEEELKVIEDKAYRLGATSLPKSDRRALAVQTQTAGYDRTQKQQFRERCHFAEQQT